MQYKIIHIFGKLNRGGSETFIMNVLRNIDRNLYQFDFMVHDKEDNIHDFSEEIKSLNCKIYSVGSVYHFFSYIINLFQFFKKSNHDIVHIHIFNLALFPLLFAKLFRKKVVVHSHNTQFDGNFIKRAVQYVITIPLGYMADYFCACGVDAAEWLFKKNINKKKNFSIINNGINTNTFKYDADLRKKYRDRLDIKNKFVIGHVGRFEIQKNHIFLIDIFNEIYNKNKKTTLFLIGRGPLEEEMKNKVKKLGLSEVVHFLGVRSDIAALMNAMDVFVFPSHYEGLGIVLIEAQATGLPCLASDTVPSEAKVTNLCSFLPLSNIYSWVESSLQKFPERKSMEEEIKQSGYQIESSVEKLCTIYRDLKNNRY